MRRSFAEQVPDALRDFDAFLKSGCSSVLHAMVVRWEDLMARHSGQEAAGLTGECEEFLVEFNRFLSLPMMAEAGSPEGPCNPSGFRAALRCRQ